MSVMASFRSKKKSTIPEQIVKASLATKQANQRRQDRSGSSQPSRGSREKKLPRSSSGKTSSRSSPAKILSSALKKAKERKESLTQQLESIIEVRRESLHQTNELEEMRQKLEAQKISIGNLSTHIMRTSEVVENHREQLCLAIRMLLVAFKTLSAAHQQLQEANKLLFGKRGHGHLRNLQNMLQTRQQYMVNQVAAFYAVKGP